MTEQQIQRSVEEIVSLALEGKGAEAWTKYYHAEVEKMDLDGVSIKGKERVLEANYALLANITAVRTYAHAGSGERHTQFHCVGCRYCCERCGHH